MANAFTYMHSSTVYSVKNKDVYMLYTTPRMMFASYNSIMTVYTRLTSLPGLPNWYRVRFPNLWFIMRRNACSKAFPCTLANLLCAILYVARKSFLDAYAPIDVDDPEGNSGFRKTRRVFKPGENFLLPKVLPKIDDDIYGKKGPTFTLDNTGAEWPSVSHYIQYQVQFDMPSFDTTAQRHADSAGLSCNTLLPLVLFLANSDERIMQHSRLKLAFLEWFDKSLDDMDWHEDLVQVIAHPMVAMKLAWKNKPRDMKASLNNRKMRKLSILECRDSDSFVLKVGATEKKKRKKKENDEGTPPRIKAPKKKAALKVAPGEAILHPYGNLDSEKKFAADALDCVQASIDNRTLEQKTQDPTYDKNWHSLAQPVVGLAATINAAEKFLRVALAASNTMVGWNQVSFSDALDAVAEATDPPNEQEDPPTPKEMRPFGKNVARNMAISMINNIIPALTERYFFTEVATQVGDTQELKTLFESERIQKMVAAHKKEEEFMDVLTSNQMASAYTHTHGLVEASDCFLPRALSAKKIRHPGTQVLLQANRMITNAGWMDLSDSFSIQLPAGGGLIGEDTVEVYDQEALLNMKQVKDLLEERLERDRVRRARPSTSAASSTRPSTSVASSNQTNRTSETTSPAGITATASASAASSSRTNRTSAATSPAGTRPTGATQPSTGATRKSTNPANQAEATTSPAGASLHVATQPSTGGKRKTPNAANEAKKAPTKKLKAQNKRSKPVNDKNLLDE